MVAVAQLLDEVVELLVKLAHLDAEEFQGLLQLAEGGGTAGAGGTHPWAKARPLLRIAVRGFGEVSAGNRRSGQQALGMGRSGNLLGQLTATRIKARGDQRLEATPRRSVRARTFLWAFRGVANAGPSLNKLRGRLSQRPLTRWYAGQRRRPFAGVNAFRWPEPKSTACPLFSLSVKESALSGIFYIERVCPPGGLFAAGRGFALRALRPARPDCRDLTH